jgi:hypothetical protein
MRGAFLVYMAPEDFKKNVTPYSCEINGALFILLLATDMGYCQYSPKNRTRR